jgi:hypothetical protein
MLDLKLKNYFSLSPCPVREVVLEDRVEPAGQGGGVGHVQVARDPDGDALAVKVALGTMLLILNIYRTKIAKMELF